MYRDESRAGLAFQKMSITDFPSPVPALAALREKKKAPDAVWAHNGIIGDPAISADPSERSPSSVINIYSILPGMIRELSAIENPGGGARQTNVCAGPTKERKREKATRRQEKRGRQNERVTKRKLSREGRGTGVAKGAKEEPGARHREEGNIGG